MNLTDVNGTVSGTGAAMGVDAPDLVSVTGNEALPFVVLTFQYMSGATARFAATQGTSSLLVGRVVFDSSFGGTIDSLTYVRQ